MDELRIDGAVETENAQFIVIQVGEEQYGINIAFVDNIVRMQAITRVPKSAPYIKGVINLRGIVVPVMSLRLKMGLQADEYTKSTRIIILKLEHIGTVGVIVDEVKEVITLDSSEIEKVATDTASDKVNFVQSVGKSNGGLVSILDLNAVGAE
jgi:purine-binding chemotaxis protein CheW